MTKAIPTVARARFGGLLLVTACSAPATEDPEELSDAATTALYEVYGQGYDDTAGEFGGGLWFVGGVVQRDAGAAVVLEQEARKAYLPIRTDGDVADLYRRLTGRAHDSLSGELSAAYRRATGS